MPKQLVIFDWDGTLMDSTGRIVACMKAAASDLALPELSDQAVQQIIGLGLPQAIITLYPELGEADAENMRSRYAAHFIEAESEPNKLFDGVATLLARLRDQDRLLAVATGKSRKGLERVWGNTGYGEWFHASRCADESFSKPHPHMVQSLLTEFSVEPDAAVVVGDTTHDLLMAANAGVDAIGVSWGAHDREQLASASPLALTDRIEELSALLTESLQEKADV